MIDKTNDEKVKELLESVASGCEAAIAWMDGMKGFKEYLSTPYFYKGEKRFRYSAEGKRGNRTGDIIRLRIASKRWALARNNGESGIIVGRYFTVNNCEGIKYRNYHARVLILSGEHQMKTVSIPM